MYKGKSLANRPTPTTTISTPSDWSAAMDRPIQETYADIAEPKSVSRGKVIKAVRAAAPKTSSERLQQFANSMKKKGDAQDILSVTGATGALGSHKRRALARYGASEEAMRQLSKKGRES